MLAHGVILKAGVTKRPGAAKATALISLVLWLGVDLRRPPDRIFLMEAAMRRMRVAIFAFLLGFCSAAEIAAPTRLPAPGRRCALAVTSR